jgi:hypothetical protein
MFHAEMVKINLKLLLKFNYHLIGLQFQINILFCSRTYVLSSTATFARWPNSGAQNSKMAL